MQSNKPIAIVLLDIGSKEEQIQIYEDDDIHYLASYFCERHQLGPQCLNYILTQIQNQLPKPSLRKQIQERLNQLKVHKHHRKTSSIHDKLYDEAKEQQAMKLKMKELNEIQRKNKESMEIDQKYMVSNQTNELVQKLNRNKTQANINEYLYQEAKCMQERKQDAINRYLKKQRSYYLAKPKINEKSRQLARQSRSCNSIFEKLYQHSKDRKKELSSNRKKIFDEMCPFSPQTNKRKQWNQVSQQQQKKHAQNLVDEQKKQKEIHIKKCQEQLNYVDQITGQKLFTPQLNKNKYFYAVSKKREREDQEIAQEIASQKNKKSKTKIFEKKQQFNIYNNLILRQQLDLDQEFLQEIIEILFNKLDSDHDGLISKENVSFKDISGEELEIITQVLLELHDCGQRWDFIRFFEACAEKQLLLKIAINSSRL